MARPIDTATRERIKALISGGSSFSEIARITGKGRTQIMRIARALGIAAKVHGKIVEKDGKRKCSRCGKWKTPGAFPSAKHTACRVCYKPSA
jgi:hypothetical protein